MKYTLETTETGCRATLEFEDSKIGTVRLMRNIERVPGGCQSRDQDFLDSMTELGYNDEILDKVNECFSNFMELEFIELHEIMKED